MSKKEFLKLLELELKRINYPESKSLIDFYEELIEDKIESGKKEKEVIKEIGSVEEIIKNISVDQKIAIAKEKPTISNGFKALFAVLGIMSLPLLLPIGFAVLSVIFALFLTLFAVIFSLGVAILSGFGVLIALCVKLATGSFTLLSFIFSVGGTFVLIGLFIELFRLAIILPKKLIVFIIKQLDKNVNQKKE